MATFFVNRASVAPGPSREEFVWQAGCPNRSVSPRPCTAGWRGLVPQCHAAQPVTVREFPRGSALASPGLRATWQLLARIHLGTGDRSAARYS